MLNSLSDLSLTVTTGGGAAGGNASGAEGDGAQVAATQPLQTKTVNLNVELIKFDEKKSGGSGGGEVANGNDVAAGGDAGSARIESVDTTTV